MEQLLYNVEDTSEILGISRATLYRLKKSRQLMPRKIGNRTLYHIDDLKDFAKEQTVDAESILKNMGVKIKL
jgi:hypothetical protein